MKTYPNVVCFAFFLGHSPDYHFLSVSGFSLKLDFSLELLFEHLRFFFISLLLVSLKLFFLCFWLCSSSPILLCLLPLSYSLLPDFGVRLSPFFPQE